MRMLTPQEMLAGLLATQGQSQVSPHALLAAAARAATAYQPTPDQQDRMRSRTEGTLGQSPTTPEGYAVQRRLQQAEEQRRLRRGRARPIPTRPYSNPGDSDWPLYS